MVKHPAYTVHRKETDSPRGSKMLINSFVSIVVSYYYKMHKVMISENCRSPPQPPLNQTAGGASAQPPFFDDYDNKELLPPHSIIMWCGWIFPPYLPHTRACARRGRCVRKMEMGAHLNANGRCEEEEEGLAKKRNRQKGTRRTNGTFTKLRVHE